MKVKELFYGLSIPSFFILDSHQTAMHEQAIEHQHEDTDFIAYGYNIHNFNKLEPGAAFLYRRPGKLAPDKKFHIYGGGLIESISEPDPSGKVVANIKYGFTFNKSIDQGDPFIEDFVWSTRNKPGPGWKGFWLNYGMNRIDSTDFWALVEDLDCSLQEHANDMGVNVFSLEEALPIDYPSIPNGFLINISDQKRLIHGTKPTNNVVLFNRRIDFDSLNKRRKTIGTAGELIVLEYENERLAKLGIDKQAEHVSNTIGDHLGYDIKSYDENGDEVHIEVKTTTSNSQDGFYLSKNEINASKNPQYQYKIYRVYNYNHSLGRADIVIFDCPLEESLFRFESVSYCVKYR